MLQRRTAANGAGYYVSEILESAGVPHAFSTRQGGVSSGPFASLNLGNPSGCAEQDAAAAIQENYARLQGAIGAADRQRCWVHQVHGRQVRRVCSGAGHTNGLQGDALVGDDAAGVLAVRTADCVPVLVATEDGRAVAAVHAGWRGVVAEVVGAAVADLAELSGRAPGGFLAAIGPCISVEAFEVGPEVIEQFRGLFGAAAPIRGNRHADLAGAVGLQLVGAGVAAHHIDLSDRCTFRDGDEFFSHRRDRGVTGRMAALIGPRG